jgi:RNA polymerase sigma-70 factor (ECF subfamily)
MGGENTELREQFVALYDAHAGRLLSFAFYRVHERTLAEDITADAFVKLWQRMQSGVQIENARALLYTITRGMIIDQYRKQSIRQVVPIESELDALRVEETIVNELDAKRDYAIVAKAVSSLKAEYADIIILYYLQELPITEIAHILGLTENNARVRVHRALTALREQLHYVRQ